MNEIKKVNIKLETIIKQDGDVSTYLVGNKGTVEELKERYVLKLIDQTDEGKFFIRFDLMNSGEVLLNRESEDRQSMSDFYFKLREQKGVLYKTPYGTMNMMVETKVLQTDIDKDLDNGKIEIEYRLFNHNELVGEYKLRLIFSA